MRHEIYHEDEAEIYCTDTEATVTGAVIAFKPKEYLEVAIAHRFKLNLQYNEHHDCYIGSSSGLEFQSDGPKRIV